MRTRGNSLWVGAVVIVALALALTVVIVAVTRSGSSHGPGMMGGYRGGNGSGMTGSSSGYGGMMGSYRGGYGSRMMSGAYGVPAPSSPARSASADDLSTVRDHANTWLRARGLGGLKVAEVMAFTRNDYVAIEDASGHGAFELLSGPRGEWLMPEPGPNMMWNTRYGMMGGSGMMGGYGGYGAPSQGGQRISASRAHTIASQWLDKNLPGRQALDPRAFPGYYTIDIGANGHPVGMLSVHASTGAVWYHTWHGRFLAERDY